MSMPRARDDAGLVVEQDVGPVVGGVGLPVEHRRDQRRLALGREDPAERAPAGHVVGVVRLLVLAGAQRDDEQVVGVTGGPSWRFIASIVAAIGRVVHEHAAVDEGRVTASERREVRRRRRGGEPGVDRAELRGAGLPGLQEPRLASLHVVARDQEPGQRLRQGRLAEAVSERSAEPVEAVLRVEQVGGTAEERQAPEGRPREDRARLGAAVELDHLGCAHRRRAVRPRRGQPQRDQAAGGGARDQVEPGREGSARVALADQLLEAGEDDRGDQPADAAAVDREDAEPRARRRLEVAWRDLRDPHARSDRRAPGAR